MTSQWRHHSKTHICYSELNYVQNLYFGFFIFGKLTVLCHFVLFIYWTTLIIFTKFDLRQVIRAWISVCWCWYVISRCNLDLWPLDLLKHFGCYVFKLCTKFEQNRIIHSWVIDDLARFRRAILGSGHNWQELSQGCMDPTSLNVWERDRRTAFSWLRALHNMQSHGKNETTKIWYNNSVSYTRSVLRSNSNKILCVITNYFFAYCIWKLSSALTWMFTQVNPNIVIFGPILVLITSCNLFLRWKLHHMLLLLYDMFQFL